MSDGHGPGWWLRIPCKDPWAERKGGPQCSGVISALTASSHSQPECLKSPISHSGVEKQCTPPCGIQNPWMESAKLETDTALLCSAAVGREAPTRVFPSHGAAQCRRSCSTRRTAATAAGCNVWEMGGEVGVGAGNRDICIFKTVKEKLNLRQSGFGSSAKSVK